MLRFSTIGKNPFNDADKAIILVVCTSRLMVAMALALRGRRTPSLQGIGACHADIWKNEWIWVFGVKAE
jgi:hypothetical protein